MKKLFAVLMVLCLLVSMQVQITVIATNKEEDRFSNVPYGIVDDIVIDRKKDDQKELSDSEKLFESITKETHLLDYVDAEQFASRKHVARETEKEDLDTYVFMNEDGTSTLYLMAENVKFVAPDGSIREKNIDLISQEGKYRTSDNNIDVSLSKDHCETEVVFDDNSLKMKASEAECIDERSKKQ